MASILYLEKEPDVRRYAEMFDQLRANGLGTRPTLATYWWPC
jgi:hypothetical protein